MRRRDAANTPLLRIQAHFAVPRTASGHLPTLRIAALRATAACIALVAIVFLAACGPTARVQPVLTERCLRLGGPRQVITVPITIRAAGLLHVSIRERGISAVAAAAANESGNGDGAASPIDRLGTITLAIDATAARVVLVRISSVDSRDITADVCVSAELVSPSDAENARAWREMAAGDDATGRRRWQDAFDRYLAAARLFDGLGMRDHAAAARHAMAELEYGYLQRERDSMALSTIALSEDPNAAPEIRAARLTLIAKALVQGTTVNDSWAERIHELLHVSDRLFRSSSVGARERPRLEILAGFARYREGKLDEAVTIFDRAADDCSALRDWECFARARQNLAALAEDQQNYPAALNDYDEALRTLDASRKPLLFADISDNLARLQGRVGLIHRSEQAERTAMRLYAQLSDCDGARRSVSSLGEMLVRIGSVEDAARYLHQATTLDCPDLLVALRSAPDRDSDFAPRRPSPDMRALGRAASDHGSVCSRRALTADLTLEGQIAVFRALLASAEMTELDGRLSDARTCLSLARRYAADPRSQIRLADASGELFLKEAHSEAARAAFDGALHTADSAAIADSAEFQGKSLLGLAEVGLRTGELASARERADAALRISSTHADINQLVTSLRLISTLEERAGRIDAAIHTLRGAVRLMEQIPTEELDPETRAIYLATQHAVFAELTEFLVARDEQSSHRDAGSAWRAFEVADEGHSRSIRYALNQATYEPTPGRSADLTNRYRSLLRQIASLSRSDIHETGDSGLIDGIFQLDRDVASEQEVVDRSGLMNELRETHATLVEYALGRSDLFAFVLDAGTVHVVRLGNAGEISRAAADLADRLRDPEQVPDEIRASARRLAERVWWPISGFITQRRIILVPEEGLHTVPFAVLPWSPDQPKTLIVSKAEVSSVPSALFLQRANPTRTRRSTGTDFVLVGDPVLRRIKWQRTCVGRDDRSLTPGVVRSSFEWLRSLPSLPGTRSEVTDIAQLIRRSHPAGVVQTLLGCAATPAAVRNFSPDAALLHVATHGLVDARRPRLSTLALTPDAAPLDDGAFQLLDILSMRLQAHLVVLSACDTSQGRLLPGEGVLGLAQAFLQAGAQSVIASYWRVEDSATASFMLRFYRYLLTDKLTVGAALRRAQLDEADRGNFSWAAFGLYGRADSKL